jgi:hypothetical protein
MQKPICRAGAELTSFFGPRAVQHSTVVWNECCDAILARLVKGFRLADRCYLSMRIIDQHSPHAMDWAIRQRVLNASILNVSQS